jgi:predicted DNA-binding transcriptional regulator YafY
MSIDKLKRQHLVLNYLQSDAKSFVEIQEFLSDASHIHEIDTKMSLRTFQRDIKEIKNAYRIEITFDKTTSKYYIDKRGSSNNMLLGFVGIYEVMQVKSSMSNNIQFERNQFSGVSYVISILIAISRKRVLDIVHQKFGFQDTVKYRVEAYGVKEFHYRWYLVGKDLGDGKIKNFALDRVVNMQIARKKYHIPESFSMHDYFKYSYGIMGGGKDPNYETIVLSFDSKQKGYIETKPYHDSQKVLIDNDLEYRVELTMVITKDFVMDILRRLPDVRVMKPNSLITEIQTILERSISLYKK